MTLRTAVVSAALAVTFCWAAPATAQVETGATSLCQPPDDCPVLHLGGFLQRVVRSNPEAQSLRLEDDRAAARLQDARGGFDPRLVSGYEYKTQDDADKLNVLRTGMDVPLNLPMSPSLTLDYRRGLGSSIDPSVSTSFDGETRFGIAFSPLSGLFLDKKQAALRKARLEPRRINAFQAQERNRLLLEATGTYLKWVEAYRKLQISRDLLALATRRRTLVTQQARAGEVAAIDSTEAQLTVAKRREEVSMALRTAKQASIKLSTFLWAADGTPAPFNFTPPSDVPLPEVRNADLLPAARTAQARRPELQQLDAEQRQARIEQRLARERLRPNLKLKAEAVSYENGPADISDVKLGFEIEQPLFFRSGRSRTERARIDTRQLSLKQDATERKVQADVEAAIVDLEQTRQRLDAAEERVELAQQLQEGEQRRFNLGESTLFLLNQRDQALAQAREARVTARTDVLRAWVTYRWATGTIADDLQTAGL